MDNWSEGGVAIEQDRDRKRDRDGGRETPREIGRNYISHVFTHLQEFVY